jgi:1-acyl-sn-glycerol-3-phosphate acyltransferase
MMENDLSNARFRLVCLWVSQTARVLADCCLRIFVVLEMTRAGTAERDAAWHLVTALLMLPAVFLAPVNGALSNSLPKRWVLAGSAAACTLVVAVFGILAGTSPVDYGTWLVCWALVAIGSAVYSPTRYALLPAAAEDTRIPLTRVNAWIEMGAVSAIVAGLVMGGWLHEYLWDGLEAAVAAALALYGLALLMALPVWFRADVHRPEYAGQAVAGFFRDCRRILGNPEARASLLGLSALRGLITAMTGALIAATLSVPGRGWEDLFEVGLWVMGGIAAGSLLAGVQRHPRRVLGLVPLGATGLVLGLILAALGSTPSPFLCIVLGAMGGLVNVPLAATYQAALPADARGNGMAVRNFTDYVLITGMSMLMFALARLEILSATGQLWLVALLAAVGAVVSWRKLFRESAEQLLEILIWPFYRIRAHGPGLEKFPRFGPVLVVANHSAWFDPIWQAKVLPRRLIALLTSQFYDLPPLRWLMKHVVRAIRIQASTYRREVPELKKVIATLDQGEAVVIFPEGALRKKEEQFLRLFGQGVWLILKERPQTPVVVCWIEGGWGSYFSYFKGPPTKNKRMDFWRHIDIAVTEPQLLSPELLADQRATRAYLMQECANARKHLGLEVPQLRKAEEQAIGAQEQEETA